MTLIVSILLFLVRILFGVTLPLFFIIIAVEFLMRGHDLPTSSQTTRALAKIIGKYKPEAKNFYDLGCAHGTLSLRMKKLLPHLDIYGIDNSALRIFFAKLKSRILRRKINFQKEDIFKIDLSKAEVVYAYLSRPYANFRKEVREGIAARGRSYHQYITFSGLATERKGKNIS